MRALNILSRLVTFSYRKTTKKLQEVIRFGYLLGESLQYLYETAYYRNEHEPFPEQGTNPLRLIQHILQPIEVIQFYRKYYFNKDLC